MKGKPFPVSVTSYNFINLRMYFHVLPEQAGKTQAPESPTQACQPRQRDRAGGLVEEHREEPGFHRPTDESERKNSIGEFQSSRTLMRTTIETQTFPSSSTASSDHERLSPSRGYQQEEACQ